MHKIIFSPFKISADSSEYSVYNYMDLQKT